MNCACSPVSVAGMLWDCSLREVALKAKVTRLRWTAVWLSEYESSLMMANTLPRAGEVTTD